MSIQTDNLYMNSAFGSMNRILNVIERNMDNTAFNLEELSCEKLGISDNKRARLLKMLVDAGYIEGVKVVDRGEPTVFDPPEYERFKVSIGDIALTIKGLQFLAENTVTAHIYRTVKSVKDLIP